MADTDPAFADTSAVECLWDCQPEIRELGVACVDIDDPAALARLQVIAADPAEDEEIQHTAQSRIDDR